MPFYQKGAVRIYFEETGSGYPLLLIPGGGLNSTLGFFTKSAPFNAIAEFKGEYRCIAADLRNAHDGQSTGPLESDRPWDAYADDQLGLMDHLGIDKFMVMGFCIGGPFIWNLLKRAPDRIVAAVLAQPSGSRPEARDLFYDTNSKGWGPKLAAQRPEIGMDAIDKFLTKMYRTDPDFVFTVSRDFVRGCQTPVLILPDDIPAHPNAVAMETAMLAPQAEVSFFPWKEPKQRVPLAVRQIRSFLRAHTPAAREFGQYGKVAAE
jgi:pimeloyl-ACP methyl ester carboxylesterase